LKVIHIEHWVQTKEWWNTELEGIVPYIFGYGVWTISKQAKLAVGSNEVLLLQM
jgi:hypothetical protein